MKHVLITGASRGLGRELAATLAGAGHKVAINYRASEKAAIALSSSLNNSIAVRADIGDMAQVMAMEKEIRKSWGRLDVLINNAGIAKDGLLIKTEEADWDKVIRTNLKGCFNTIRAFAPLIAESGGGHIINVSSRSGLFGSAGQSAYSASKAGILGLTYTSASELAGMNIVVNALLPGYMPTDMGAMSKEATSRAKSDSLFGTLSDPANVANFILWLIATSNITGQVFNLDSRM